MSRDPAPQAYAAALAAAVGGVALWRWDLVAQAFRVTLHQLQRGGAARDHVLFEIVLFAAILLATLKVVPSRSRGRQDLLVVAVACIAGWLAEAWGTRMGLWTYYTGEAPPLWIVPAWPLGALVIDRVSAGAASPPQTATVQRAVYWTAAAAAVLYMLWFVSGKAGGPATVLVFAVILWALAYKPMFDEDLRLLSAGMFCVFFADLWGVTNHCWAYHTQAAGLPAAAGIAFGAAFDATVVLACWKAARAYRS